MTNLKRVFTHKSKFLLTILCLLGLAFSYSCSCRDDNPYKPDDGVNEKDNNSGLTGRKSNVSGGYEYKPETHLSTHIMVLSSDGKATSKISITLINDDIDENTWTIDGEGITKEDFDYKNGVLSLKKASFDKATTTKKNYNFKHKV